MHQAAFEEVRIEGHLIDSGTMSSVMDHIIAMGGEFETLSFDVGRTNVDPSVAVLRVRADSRQILDEILLALDAHLTHGLSQPQREFPLLPALAVFDQRAEATQRFRAKRALGAGGAHADGCSTAIGGCPTE